ncbi:putative shikimate dehydrogenase [Selenomonas ruminantium subsp. lactilytica TAM6421]|uniref:Shikimate dehydrogenase (NADP(+)) n=1 Tax=Selenomonas ruminantium subsp. lactilytica (strain NBRC 103574 / TAM6421) TaxID=927704 RepID=I0GPK1_SELRL|nr:shikimate dehydrogenase [Selenomonas ruminantium]BAL82688.1 putative shikimate dehydrogenase [Selenomonas ruminantium subsp. lactilytica TAM6421]
MITGKTQNLGVIGWPIAHSLSPVLQNAAIEKAGIDYNYTALPVAPEKLAEAVTGLKALHYRGWNVTIPHKTAIMPLLDEIDEDARIIGAVNTVVNDNGKLKGFNTDCLGFMGALTKRQAAIKGKKVVLLGAGGAARAVIWGLIKAEAQEVVLGVRNPAKAESLAAEFSRYGKVTVCHWESEEFTQVLADCALLVNTTPLGMTPKVDACPPVDWSKVNPSAVVYDIIYTPAETLFLRQAREHGHVIINGEEMLAGQGAAALQLWTGCEPDLSCMQMALRKALEN